MKNGGKGPNRTVDRILLESPLVQAYQNAQAMIQKSFLHTHLTARHSDPNMMKTFEALMARFEMHSPHDIQVGRKSRHEIPDLMEKGQELMGKAARGELEGGDAEQITDDSDNTAMGMDDVLVELL